MRHHLFYSTRTIGTIIAIIGLTVMMFITACAGYGPSSTASPGATVPATPSPSPACTVCKYGTLPECVMGYEMPGTLQLFSQNQQGFIVFSTQVVDVGGNGGGAGNYKITARIPAGLLPNQQAVTEVDINSKTDTSAVNNAVLSPGQDIIIAAILNPTSSGNLSGIQILPSNSQFVMDCRNVVGFVTPPAGQNKITYWQGGDQPLSVNLDSVPDTKIDVTKPVEVFTLFQAGSTPTVLKVQNVG